MPPLNDRLRVLVITLVCLTTSSVIALLALSGSGELGEPQQFSEYDDSFEQAAVSRAGDLATQVPTPTRTSSNAITAATSPAPAASITPDAPPTFPDIELIAPARARLLAENASTSTSTRADIAEATTTTMLFVGDMFFDRHIRLAAAKNGGDYLFSCIDPLFESVDMVVGNLEGPITANASVSVGTKQDNPQHFQFTFPTSTAAVLARHNVRLVNLGNNHIANFGKSGIAATHGYLEKAGVAYFGGIVGNSPIYRARYRGRPFSFVNYNQFGGESAKVVASRIAQEKSWGSTVIVYTHWGDEYAYGVASMQKAARLFAENGADVIIGSHPHVVLDSARIGQTLIYYSLGNFIFDQYFNARVKNGLAVALTFSAVSSTPALVNVQEYPVVLKTDGRTCLVEEGK
jgi:poly-gamma-glutamate synthesis protein (capsule biosynthesis protein)